MVIRKILVCLLIILSGTLAFLISNGYYERSETQMVGPLGVSLPPSELDNKTPTVLNSPPQSMRTALEDAYRLPVDRRFNLAVAEVHHFITGEEKEEANTTFKNGKWEILYKGEIVARVPDLPDFSDVMKSLVPWAKNLAKKYDLKLTLGQKLPKEMDEIQQLIDGFFAPNLLKAAKILNQLWSEGNRHPKILETSSRALVLLSLQNYDKLNIADPLLAKSFATVVVTLALTNTPIDREESLLAEIMGYGAHAMRKSKSLPKNDPVRLYVNQNNKQLMSLALKSDKNIESKFMVLNQLAEKGDLNQWMTWMQTHFGKNQISLAILGTGLKLNTFRGNRHYPRLVQGTVNFEMVVEAQPKVSPVIPTIDLILSYNNIYKLLKVLLSPDSDLSTLIMVFESTVESNADTYKGPFIDRSTYQSFYESYFFTSLYKEGLHYLDSLASVEASESFLKQLKGSSLPNQARKKIFALIRIINNKINEAWTTKSLIENPFNLITSERTTSTELIHWYKHLLKAEMGKGDVEDLATDITSLQHLGDSALHRTYKALGSYIPFRDPAQFTIVKRWVHRMDSRVSHRIQLGWFAKDRLLDLKMMDHYYQSAFSTNPNTRYGVQYSHAYFARDIKKLLSLADNPNVPLDDRGKIIKSLGELKAVKPKEQKKRFQKLIREHPENWRLISKFADFLIDEKDYLLTRSIIQDWLDQDHLVGGLERILARNKIAKTYYLEEQYEMAWKTISNIIEGQQGGTLILGGKILEKLGEIAKAEQIFSFALQRYPKTTYVKEFSGFLWRNGKYSQAADLISKFQSRIAAMDWLWEIGDAFAEVFKDRTAEGVLAFHELRPKVRPYNLLSLTGSVFKKGNPELAFKMETSLKIEGMQQFMSRIQAFIYLKEFRPKEEALAWLKRNAPPQPSAVLLFWKKEYEYLWTFIRSPSKYGWVLRAASSLKYDGLSEEDRKKLYQYYSLPSLDEHYSSIGKYFLGQISEEELLRLATDPKKRCEYTYFIGFKAEAEGRYEDASDWYRVSIETGQNGNTEYSWAYDNLLIWQNPYKKLSLLTKEDLPS